MASLIRFVFRLPLLSSRTSRTSIATINPARRFLTTKPLHSAYTTTALAKSTTRLPTTLLQSRNALTTASASSSSATVSSPAAKPGKLRELLRKYGVTGVAVYFGISAIDLGITFLAIQAGGADSVKKVEDWMVDKFGRFGLFGQKHDSAGQEESGSDILNEMVATTKRGEKPSFASILIIAYGIHKTIMLPFRVGATAMVTPWMVRRLQRMGWIRQNAVGKM